jgi:hypothetical protein
MPIENLNTTTYFTFSKRNEKTFFPYFFVYSLLEKSLVRKEKTDREKASARAAR